MPRFGILCRYLCPLDLHPGGTVAAFPLHLATSSPNFKLRFILAVLEQRLQSSRSPSIRSSRWAKVAPPASVQKRRRRQQQQQQRVHNKQKQSPPQSTVQSPRSTAAHIRTSTKSPLLLLVLLGQLEKTLQRFCPFELFLFFFVFVSFFFFF